MQLGTARQSEADADVAASTARFTAMQPFRRSTALPRNSPSNHAPQAQPQPSIQAHPILDQRLPLAQRFGYCAESVLRILCRRHGLSTKGGKVAQIEALVAAYAGRGPEAEAVLGIGSLPCCKEER